MSDATIGVRIASTSPTMSRTPAKEETSDEPAEKTIASGTSAMPAFELPPRMSPKMNASATTKTVKIVMSRTVRQRFCACASYIETLGTNFWPPSLAIALGELHLRDVAVRLVGELEVPLRLEAERAREDVRRERLERGVEVANVAVVEAARERDLVLGRGEVLGQVLELLDRLELRVVLGHGEERAEGAGEDVLSLGHLLRLPGRAGRDRVGARLRG